MERTFEVIANDSATLAVSGEIDGSQGDAFRDELVGALRQIPGTAVSVDLSHLSFIDSSGLTALVQARAEAEQLGLVLDLRNPQTRIRRIFEITGLATVFGLD